jgi:leucyl-tRNA synthetase
MNIVKKHTNEYSSYLGGEVIFGDKDNIKTSDINLCLPTDLVIDRMDKVCIVKPIPQWYIDYANVEWKDKTLKYIESMKLTDSIHDKLVTSVKWLKEWGVSRSFGLGTKLPMDESYVIDSLSDSTIYMAYYTICHLIHDDIYGHKSKYSPEDFTEQVWDYIFFKKWDESIKIPKNELDLMNQSFEYFYPVDVRISGKDLIPNHLCMYIFNHIAIFGEEKSPITINCNGWILVNGEKMAKSKGNFIDVNKVNYCLQKVGLSEFINKLPKKINSK